ncbi:uncharacterized protein LOC101845926 [Aplysia californica]|uniref:Uncharacterized protein LOC101845926 n=1 Tax=Aplysia californica TaxID=6500 RepID=A0ABM1A0R7_APLCA|nr:uncharacterized protein LOC101845926 [Aplysia californica]
MLLVIVAIYIISLFPRIAVYVVRIFIDDFYFLGKYHNMFKIVSYSVFILDFTNSAINLFVFLAMSSSFRETFYQITTTSHPPATRPSTMAGQARREEIKN